MNIANMKLLSLISEKLFLFSDRVAKHPILTYSDDFRIFLTTPDDELEKVICLIMATKF